MILKKCILKYWKSTNAPLLTQWKGQMLYYLNVERVWVMERTKMMQFEAMWQRVMQVLEMGV
jgi:hypothetical protein